MNKKTCIDFLNKIFYQSLINEMFFRESLNLGVDFLTWPNDYNFEKAKSFYKTATQKSYNAALIENEVEVPQDAFREIITAEEVKIFYADYLGFLKALELNKKLSQNPEQATKLCNEFLNSKTSTAKIYSVDDALNNFIKSHEQKLKSGSADVILKSFPALSKQISGFNAGRVTIFTARTGFGKTNLGINLLKAAIDQDLCCAFFNMEMMIDDFAKRIAQAMFKINNYEFQNGSYVTKLNTDNKSFSKNWLTGGSSMSISEINQVVFEIKRKQELHMVFVDYDQKILMSESGAKDEWMQIKKSVESLEAMAKKESVHVVMFAQTSDDKDGVPLASQRSMQPASAVVQFLKDDDGDNVLKFIKNRFGSTTDKVKLAYNPESSSIIEVGVKEYTLPQPKTGRNIMGY